ncbi:MAG: XdhC family protein [Phycisphaerales bacterium]|nr:MAG: XdhC family protein [Phycisphaerales bacterium]
MSQTQRILETVVSELDAGRVAALCAVVATRGSTPREPGAMLCVDQAGQITGTVGGGCTEAEIRRRALELLSAESKTDPAGGARPAGTLFTFDLDNDFGTDDGLICGGHMDVAVSVIPTPQELTPIREAAADLRVGKAATLPIRVQSSTGPVEYRVRLEEPPRLVIAGGGHIGRVLAEMMLPLGFHVTVIDDRSDFANPERFPPPIKPVTGDIAKTLSDWPIDTNTYVVIVTRGHKHDEEALGAVLDSPAKYLGMIGSRRKIKVIYDDLKHAGATQAQLDRVHSPIGLDIGAVTPEEIGISIAAELISVRRADHCNIVEGPIAVTG